MPLPNRRGAPVDPVPFLVVALTGALACFVAGVPYLLAMDVAFGPAVLATCAAALFVTWGSYYEFVWAADGAGGVDRPPGPRLQRVGYAAVIGVVVGAGLLLPLL